MEPQQRSSKDRQEKEILIKEAITHPVPEDEVNEMKFTCPECGSMVLYRVETGIAAYSRIISISTNGCITYDDPEIEYADAENSSYQWAGCDYELENDNGDNIIVEEELNEALRNNSDKGLSESEE